MAKRTDENQLEIVERLRAIGCSVYPTHESGRGFPDLVVGYCGKNYLIEIKTEIGKLRPAQKNFIELWKGQVSVVRTWEEAYKVVGVTF